MVAKTETKDLPESVRRIIAPIENAMYVISGRCDTAAIADDIFRGGLHNMLTKPAEYKPVLESLTRALGNPISPQTEASELEEAHVNFSFCLIAAEEIQKHGEKALLNPEIKELRTTAETQIIDFMNRLQTLHNEDPDALARLTSRIMREKGQTDAIWTSILAGLKSADPGVTDSINNTILHSSLSHKHRQILLDKRTGKIYRAENGEIKFTGEETIPENASLIYTSSYKEPEAQAAGEDAEAKVVYDASQQIETEIAISETISIPVFGEVGILSEGKVSEAIEERFGQNGLNDDELISAFERETLAWRAHNGIEREVLLPAIGNPYNPLVRQAVKFGISATYVKGDQVIFIMNPEQNHNGQIALRGRINKAGEVILEGMPPSFVGESAHFFLSVLACHCATTGADVSLDQVRDPSFRIATQAVSSWNRNPSVRADGLSKLEIPKPGEKGIVAVQGDKEEPFLLKEKA